jgi:hypothetical protein
MTRSSANPGDIAMQSNLICVPTLAIVKARPADQNGGYLRAQLVFHQQSVNDCPADPSCMFIHAACSGDALLCRSASMPTAW